MTSTGSIRVTGIGSWPGTDMADAIKIAFAECPDLPYLPELPARGAYAGMIGRSTALLAGLAVDLQPAGWRLADRSGREHRLAVAALRSDLDLLEEHAQGYRGPVKYSVAGPWTLAAGMERPRGDRVLADPGARRDVAQSLAEGVSELVVEMRRRLPDATPLIQLDEPLLPAVLTGSVPTASGLSRHRPVEPSDVSASLTQLVEYVGAAANCEVLVHCCAADPPIELLWGTGVHGVLADLDQLRRTEWDAIGPALEAGWQVGIGAWPTRHLTGGAKGFPLATPTADRLARRVLPALRDLAVAPERAGQLMLTPACGLAGAATSEAVAVLRALRAAADIVTEQLAS